MLTIFTCLFRPLGLVATLVFWWLALAWPFPAAAKPPGASSASAPKAAAVSVDPQKHFTIVSVTPDALREEVRLRFNQPLSLAGLRDHLRLSPRVRINWENSEMTPEGVLLLRGAFKYGTGYLVSLPERLKVDNKIYVPGVTAFFMPNRPPKVEFVENKSVIERLSRQLLHVRVQNLDKLVFDGIRVPPLLLPLALAEEQTPDQEGRLFQRLQAAAAALQPLAQAQPDLAPFLSPPRQERQLFPAPESAKNKLKAISLPLTFRENKTAGAMLLVAVRDAAAGQTATRPRLFQVTDLGLTAKTGQNQVLLWVTSLKTGLPVGGARVLGFTRDLEVFPLGQTDKDGLITFTDADLKGLAVKNPASVQAVSRRLAPGELAMVMAGTADDLAYLNLGPGGRVKPEGIWQAGSGAAGRHLKGNIFTERGVYRPGEKVYYKGTLREYQRGRIFAPAGTACTLKVKSPRGEEVFTAAGPVSDFGTLAGEIATQAHWPLGTYSLTMSYGPQEQAQEEEAAEAEADGPPSRRRVKSNAPAPEVTCTFEVQEFKPPRHFADLTFQEFSRPLADPSGQGERQTAFVRITISGSYYAGGPVKHGQVRWKIHKSGTSFQVPGFDGYTFGYEGPEKGDLVESGQTILDEQGQAVIEFPLEDTVLTGQSGLYVTATVLDFDARAASASKTFQTQPERLVGLSRHPSEVQAGETQDIKVVVAGKDGKTVSQGRVVAEVMQKRWAYVAKRNEAGDVYWDDEETWRRLTSANLTLKDGGAVFRPDFAWGGEYLLCFTYLDERGRRFTAATLYQVTGEHSNYYNRDLAYLPLPLQADRQTYQPGQTARLTLSPRKTVSCYLVTVEQDGVLHHRVIKAAGGLNQVEIPIKPEYVPNVYVSFLGLTPRGDFPVLAGRYDTEAPNFTWGTLNLAVLKEVERLMVQIGPEAKELKGEPGAKVSLDFLVTDSKGGGVPVEMAVAVVDEAVLALTAFKTPDLAGLSRFDFPLGVFTSELRTWLVHQTPFYLAKSEALTGGGGLSEDLMSKLRKRFEAVAYFNPKVHTNAHGRAQVSFTLPDNLTTYRAYVVALDRGGRFASAARPFLVTKDFYLEAGMPGFFTLGDTFTFQVAAFNNTAAAGPVSLEAAASGGVSLKAPADPATLPANTSVKLPVSGRTLAAGAATVQFTGKFGKLSDALELPLKINSPFRRETSVSFGSLSGAAELPAALPAYLKGPGQGAVGPQEIQAVLTLSGSPFLRLAPGLRYLLTYPYGCVEQTSSGVLALAALYPLVKAGQIPGVEPAAVEDYLKKGLARLATLQTDTGGFAYWPGYRRPHYWGSLYALAALTAAHSQGLAVAPPVRQKAVKYVKKQLEEGPASAGAKAFACYLLAQNRALERREFQEVQRDYGRLPREGKILLLLAAQQANLRPPAQLKEALKPLLGEAAAAAGESDDDFQARYRAPALALLAGAILLPDDPRTKEEALALLGGLDRQGYWTSTSDTGWALLALGRYFQGQTFSTEAVDLSVGQPGAPQGQRFTLDPKGFRTVGLDPELLLKHPVVQVKVPAGQTVLYKLELTAPRPDLAAAGVSRGLKVQRCLKNTDGSDVIKVGDLVRVTISLEAQKPVSYLLLEDPLPAGLVAVNTAFKTEEPLPAGAAEEEPDSGGDDDDFDYFPPGGAVRLRPNYFEIREDRVLAFRERLYTGTYQFEYVARAVCQGDFIWPATQAGAMYAPGIRGAAPQDKLTVQGR